MLLMSPFTLLLTRAAASFFSHHNFALWLVEVEGMSTSLRTCCLSSSLSLIDTQQGGSNKEATRTHTEIRGHRRCHRDLRLHWYSTVSTTNTNMRKYTLNFADIVVNAYTTVMRKSDAGIQQWCLCEQSRGAVL